MQMFMNEIFLEKMLEIEGGRSAKKFLIQQKLTRGDFVKKKLLKKLANLIL